MRVHLQPTCGLPQYRDEIMAVTNVTINRNYKKPHRTNDLGVDVERLIEALDAMDLDIKNILDALALRALAAHGHAIDGISGLQDALDQKKDANATFDLNDLSDVSVANAAVNHFIRKSANGWVSVELSGTMIQSGTINQQRLPSHLTLEALDTKYSGGGIIPAIIFG